MFKPMEWCYLLKRKANDKVYQYANTVFEDYVANTVFKAEIPEHLDRKIVLDSIVHTLKFKSLV